MCVILYKEPGVQCPNHALLDACWNSNPHGFGLAIADGSSVTISKGAMQPADAEALYAMVRPEHAAIYHWRIATSGLVDTGNCHPFPVTTSPNGLRNTFVKDLLYAVAHNGVISCPPKGSKLSDTQLWVKDKLTKMVLTPTKVLYEWLDQQATRYNSRFVFMNADKTAHLSGMWVKEGDYMLSNRSYLLSFYNGCPVCGSTDTQELGGSINGLYECWDCGTVFNDQFVFEPRNSEDYKEAV